MNSGLVNWSMENFRRKRTTSSDAFLPFAAFVTTTLAAKTVKSLDALFHVAVFARLAAVSGWHGSVAMQSPEISTAGNRKQSLQWDSNLEWPGALPNGYV